MLTALSINKGGLGRFGNNCFTIAGVIGTAVKSNQSYGFLPWIVKDNELFGGKADCINDYLLNPLPPFPEMILASQGVSGYGYFWGYRDLYLPTGNWTIDAHMQSEKFFSHCMPLIRDTFRFKDEPEQNDYVAIHYRAGDYIDDERAYHPRCSKEYYLEACSKFERYTKFIFFTDKKDFVTHNDFKGNQWYELFNRYDISECQSGNYIEDFKLMKRCKHFITANSSFSLFAAILGEHPEKKIVCPKRWFGEQAGDIDTIDIYPSGAIII